MPTEILSLDLDWFNTVKKEDLKFEVRHFFATLKRECKLPRCIEFVPEHQYLYPWSVKLLDRMSCRKVNVINIDEHHDFYCLDAIDFECERAEVGCWNFFGFMAHKRMMGKYTWITNDLTAAAAEASLSTLLNEIRDANSLVVQKFRRNIRVVNSSKVFSVIQGCRFDGFMIIRSPEYTDRYRAVYHAVEEALSKELPRTSVRRYKCRVNFRNGLVRYRANNLFWKA